MATALQDIHHSPYIWRGKEISRRNTHFITSEINSIDQTIGGWPLGTLIEFTSKQVGVGEFSLLTPALKKLSQQDKWIALICPPYIPYAPALSTNGIDIKKILVIATSNTSDTAWAMDQAISSKSCSAVVGWFSFVTEKILRRLQLAMDTQETLGA
ncbi:MAG: SulA-like leucine-rich domain-containing protein, partial [Chitinophagaceae bacterium]